MHQFEICFNNTQHNERKPGNIFWLNQNLQEIRIDRM